MPQIATDADPISILKWNWSQQNFQATIIYTLRCLMEGISPDLAN